VQPRMVILLINALNQKEREAIAVAVRAMKEAYWLAAASSDSPSDSSSLSSDSSSLSAAFGSAMYASSSSLQSF